MVPNLQSCLLCTKRDFFFTWKIFPKSLAACHGMSAYNYKKKLLFLRITFWKHSRIFLLHNRHLFLLANLSSTVGHRVFLVIHLYRRITDVNTALILLFWELQTRQNLGDYCSLTSMLTESCWTLCVHNLSLEKYFLVFWGLTIVQYKVHVKDTFLIL